MKRRNLLIGSTAAVGGALLASATAAGRTMTLQGQYLTRPDGTALYVKDWGRGRPVVFAHSAGLSSDFWSYQMAHLVRQGFRCVAPDRRGHGRSSAPGEGYDYDTLADDLAGVLEALDLHDVTLVGHSMGCGEIARYLTRHGVRRVRDAVLVAPTLPFLLWTADNEQGIPRAYFENLRSQWLTDYPKWLEENTPPFFTPDTSPAMIRWGNQMAYSTVLHAAIACNMSVTETDFRAELPRIDVPVLIVHGDRDVSCPLTTTGAVTASLIPKARLVVYTGAPHGLPLTHVARLNDELTRFCGQTGPGNVSASLRR